ncbi:MAG TPA: hypothetical protein VEK08_20570 [Planctomycetota bacterium]|nr:hypothetical protein [Planctomycetota bacterium]
MDPLEITVGVLSFFFVWSTILSLGIATVLMLCMLFGRTPYPPGVPNKAVWG